MHTGQNGPPKLQRPTHARKFGGLLIDVQLDSVEATSNFIFIFIFFSQLVLLCFKYDERLILGWLPTPLYRSWEAIPSSIGSFL